MLDALRQVVHLRAYAQKKPIDEYKHEAFAMFERMLTVIREDVTRHARAGRLRDAAAAICRRCRTSSPTISIRSPATTTRSTSTPAPARSCRACRRSQIAAAGHAGAGRRGGRAGQPQRALPLRLGPQVQALPRRGGLTAVFARAAFVLGRRARGSRWSTSSSPIRATDQAVVRRLAEAVRREGYSVWWDDELPPHLSYGDVITEKIGAAKAAIVVWSRNAAASRMGPRRGRRRPQPEEADPDLDRRPDAADAVQPDPFRLDRRLAGRGRPSRLAARSRRASRRCAAGGSAPPSAASGLRTAGSPRASRTGSSRAADALAHGPLIRSPRWPRRLHRRIGALIRRGRRRGVRRSPSALPRLRRRRDAARPAGSAADRGERVGCRADEPGHRSADPAALRRSTGADWRRASGSAARRAATTCRSAAAAQGRAAGTARYCLGRRTRHAECAAAAPALRAAEVMRMAPRDGFEPTTK